MSRDIANIFERTSVIDDCFNILYTLFLLLCVPCLYSGVGSYHINHMYIKYTVSGCSKNSRMGHFRILHSPGSF